MRIAYGYNRAQRDFVHLNVERVWLDNTSSDRRERVEMFANGLRDGDTLVLLDRKDLGRGNGLIDKAERLGVTVEAHDPKKAPAPRGRPTKFNPTKDQDAEIKAFWYNIAYEGGYVVSRACEIMGQPVKRHHLTHRYGNRDQSTLQ